VYNRCKLRGAHGAGKQDRRSRKTEVAWSGCTNDWESFKSIDDAPGGRGHCRERRYPAI